jgi:hypothetical protein
MLKILLISFMSLFSVISADDWICYGTITLNPFTYIDNPTTNLNGLVGEQSFPYTVPAGKQLRVTYMQTEGPATPQFGMFIWLGAAPATNAKSLISCTTAGGSTQLYGMNLIIPEGKIVNIRCMNNTATAWVNGFCVQGLLEDMP